MLAGRLEIFPILLLFSRSTWNINVPTNMNVPMNLKGHKNINILRNNDDSQDGKSEDDIN
jgi:hypothetical protein